VLAAAFGRHSGLFVVAILPGATRNEKIVVFIKLRSQSSSVTISTEFLVAKARHGWQVANPPETGLGAAQTTTPQALVPARMCPQ